MIRSLRIHYPKNIHVSCSANMCGIEGNQSVDVKNNKTSHDIPHDVCHEDRPLQLIIVNGKGNTNQPMDSILSHMQEAQVDNINQFEVGQFTNSTPISRVVFTEGKSGKIVTDGIHGRYLPPNTNLSNEINNGTTYTIQANEHRIDNGQRKMDGYQSRMDLERMDGCQSGMDSHRRMDGYQSRMDSERKMDGYQSRMDSEIMDGCQSGMDFHRRMDGYQSRMDSERKMDGYQSGMDSHRRMDGYGSKMDSEKKMDRYQPRMDSGRKMDGYQSRMDLERRMDGCQSGRDSHRRMDGYQSRMDLERMDGCQSGMDSHRRMDGYQTRMDSERNMDGYQSRMDLERMDWCQSGMDSHRWMDGYQSRMDSERKMGGYQSRMDLEIMDGCQSGMDFHRRMDGYQSRMDSERKMDGYQSRMDLQRRMDGCQSGMDSHRRMDGYQSRMDSEMKMDGYQSRMDLERMDGCQSGMDFHRRVDGYGSKMDFERKMDGYQPIVDSRMRMNKSESMTDIGRHGMTNRENMIDFTRTGMKSNQFGTVCEGKGYTETNMQYGSRGRTSKPMFSNRSKISSYDGSTDWSDYLVQFEMVSQLNGWDNHTKAMELATSLKGPALTVMVDLDPTLRSDYLELVNALDIRFKATSSSELYRVQMKTRVKKRAESLAEMAQDIKRLTRQAYPLYPATMREPLALDCFVDALPDQEMRWTIYQNKPKTLDEALQLATEYEGFRMAAEKRHQTKSSMSSSRVNQDNYVFAMDGISEETQGNIYRYNSRNCANCKERGHHSRDCPKPRKCYNCGEEGHYKRNCPKQTQRNHHHSQSDSSTLENGQGN